MGWREAVREYKEYHDADTQDGMERYEELYKKIKEIP